MAAPGIGTMRRGFSYAILKDYPGFRDIIALGADTEKVYFPFWNLA